MGIFDLFTAGKQAEEITRAFIGAYAVSRMDDDQRQVIMFRVYRMLCESGPFRLSFDEANKKFNTSPAFVQAGLMANAMINLKMHHGVSGFQWDYIPNPFALSIYSEKALKMAISKIRKYGINPDECFAGPKEI
jgi:hypothetical protein